MKKDFNLVRPSGSEKKEPLVIGEVLNEYFQSDEPLAVAFRNWKAKQEETVVNEDECQGDQLFKSIHPNTELGVDLKLLTREPGRMNIGEIRSGAITRDGEDHFTFIESVLEKKMDLSSKRNPHVLKLNRINENRKEDGTLYPTFNRPRYTDDFTFQDFCREAAEELLMIAGDSNNFGLVEEISSK